MKCKARLVARYGTDCDEVYSHVFKHATIRAFLTWIAYNKAKVFPADVKTTFPPWEAK